MVIPVLDKTVPSIAACLDTSFRAFGGVPTYCLTDNEKTVTTAHIATIPVRNPEIVPNARYDGTAIRTCMPADPASRGGAENAVKIAKRDLVPTGVNLRRVPTVPRSTPMADRDCDLFPGQRHGCAKNDGADAKKAQLVDIHTN